MTIRPLCDHRMVGDFLRQAIGGTSSGAVIECGVYEGYTSLHMRRLHSRTQYACDTFSGMPYDGNAVEAAGGFVRGHLAPSVDDVAERLHVSGIRVLAGCVEDMLPSLDPGIQFAFVFLDMDLEVPTQFAVDYLLPRMVSGGIIGFHDYVPNRPDYCLRGIVKIVDGISGVGMKRLRSPRWFQFMEKV